MKDIEYTFEDLRLAERLQQWNSQCLPVYKSFREFSEKLTKNHTVPCESVKN